MGNLCKSLSSKARESDVQGIEKMDVLVPEERKICLCAAFLFEEPSEDG